MNEELAAALGEAAEARANGWKEPTIGDALALQLQRSDRLKEAGWDPEKIRFEDHAAVLNGSLVPPKEARMQLVSTDGERAHSWKPIDLLAFFDSPPEPPTIGGLAYPGRRHIYSGEPESCKTWAALVLAVDEIRAGREVVFIDHEMGARDHTARLRALGLTEEQIGSFVYVCPSEPMVEPSILADVDQLLSVVRPSLIVIDAFTGALELHDADPNQGVQVERFYRTVVEPLRRYGAAVLILDHVTKAKDNRGRYSIGAERKLGGADVHLGFEVVKPFGRGKSGLVKVITHRDRPGYLPRPRAAEFQLESDAESGAVTWQIKPPQHDPSQGSMGFRPTHLMAKISEFVGAAAEPPSRNEVEQGVGGKRDFVRQAIDVLLAEGYMKEQPGPRNSRLLEFVKHYREGQDDAA